MNNSVFYDKNNDRFYCSDKIKCNLTPITFCYHIGYDCNLSCDYCLSKNNITKYTEKDLSNYIKYIEEWKPLRVVISGGEPLIYINKLSKILKHLKSNGINTIVSTNGILIKEVYSKVRSLIDWYDISLPAISKETYLKVRGKDKFEEVLEGIDLLIGKNEHVRLAFTINKHNISEILDIPKFAISHGIDNIRIGHTYCNKNGKLKRNLWKDEYANAISSYEDRISIYYPLSNDQLKLYNSSYIILENDGSIYRSMVNSKSYICHISAIDNFTEAFVEIAKKQMKLFVEDYNE